MSKKPKKISLPQMNSMFCIRVNDKNLKVAEFCGTKKDTFLSLQAWVINGVLKHMINKFTRELQEVKIVFYLTGSKRHNEEFKEHAIPKLITALYHRGMDDKYTYVSFTDHVKENFNGQYRASAFFDATSEKKPGIRSLAEMDRFFEVIKVRLKEAGIKKFKFDSIHNSRTIFFKDNEDLNLARLTIDAFQYPCWKFVDDIEMSERINEMKRFKEYLDTHVKFEYYYDYV